MILWIWEYFPTKFLDLPVILTFVYVPTPLLSSARLQSTEFNSALLKQGASKVRLFPRPLQIFRPSCSPLYMYRHPAQFSPSSEHRNSTPLLKQSASKVRLFPTFLQGKVSTKLLDLPAIISFVYVPTSLLISVRLQNTKFNSTAETGCF